MLSQTDQHAIDHYGYASTGGSIGKPKKKDDTDEYIERLRKDPDLLERHKENEREYQERMKNNFEY